MAEGRQRSAWAVASHGMALLANCHAKDGGFVPSDFDPFACEAEETSDVAGTVHEWLGTKEG